MTPTHGGARKETRTVIITCPVPVSCSSKTMTWIMQVRAVPTGHPLTLTVNMTFTSTLKTSGWWHLWPWHEKEKINVFWHLLSLRRFPKASVSPEPPWGNWWLCAAICPSAHQRCNEKQTIKQKHNNNKKNKRLKQNVSIQHDSERK